MVDRDVVLAKLATIDRCLGRIAEVRDRAELRPIDVEDLTVVNLSRAAQAAIDLAAHVVTTEALGYPGTLAESFTLLEKEGLLDATLAERMRKMVGFRNIAVHAYEAVDARIVQAIVDHHLGDLREFARGIAARYLAG